MLGAMIGRQRLKEAAGAVVNDPLHALDDVDEGGQLRIGADHGNGGVVDQRRLVAIAAAE